MEFKYLPLKIMHSEGSCDGEVKEYFLTIAITERKEIYFTGICPKCHGTIAALKPLSELYRDCLELFREDTTDNREFDKNFLKQLHITLGEENAAQ